MAAACPQCNRDDAVQKVSAIISGGTFQTSYSVPAQGQLGGHTIYGMVNQTGTSQTNLAQRLNPPSDKDWKALREKWEKQPKDNWILQDYLKQHPRPMKDPTARLRSVLAYLSLLGVLASMVMCGLGGASSRGRGFDMATLATLIFLASLALLVVAAVIWRIATPPELRAWADETAAFRRSIIPTLQRQASAASDRLYYCHRDDVVFLPESTFCRSAADASGMGFWLDLAQL